MKEEKPAFVPSFVNKQSPLPRYVQARNYLEKLINEGGYESGDQLPSERELATQFQVSQMTMNRALQDMVRDGILYREVGRGTFVMHRNHGVLRSGTLAFVTVYSPGELRRDMYSSEILRGVQTAAFSTQWDLKLIQEPLTSESESIPARLRDRADGFLLVSPGDGALPALRNIRDEKLCFLSLGSSWLDEDIPAVDSDNILGARQAVEYLAGLGHKRIGFLGAPEDMSNAYDRREGFCRAMDEMSLPIRKEWMLLLQGQWAMPDSEREQILRIATNPDGPTAFFTAGYFLAVNSIETMQSAGLRIPADISVVGFDDKFSAAFLNPPLTTIAQPLEEMGERAVRRLEAMIQGKDDAVGVERLPTHMVVRQSCAAPRAD